MRAFSALPWQGRKGGGTGGTWQHLSWAKIVFNCGARSWHLVIAECTATDTQYSQERQQRRGKEGGAGGGGAVGSTLLLN